MTPILKHKCILGESPLWDAHTKTLWWVDIKSSTIHQVIGKVHTEHKLTVRPSALGLTTSGTLIVAAENALYLYDPTTQKLTQHLTVPEPTSNRTNDGKVGPDGAFWFGTMDDAEEDVSGALYSYHPDRGLQKHLNGIKISNTFAWSPDGTLMYFADSAQQTIWRMTFNTKTGGLGDQEVFVSLKDTDCYPDGSAMDANGCLWNAQWGGSRVVQYAPDGSEKEIIGLPTAQPTSCAFVGSHLLVTTASIGLQGDPFAGLTFLIPVGVEGASISKCRLS